MHQRNIERNAWSSSLHSEAYNQFMPETNTDFLFSCWRATSSIAEMTPSITIFFLPTEFCCWQRKTSQQKMPFMTICREIQV